MKLTGILDRIAGRGKEVGSDEATAGVDYKGYTIRPAASQQGSQWLTEAIITKVIDESERKHHHIRAETHSTKDDADAHSMLKAKQIIDQLGDRLFESR